MRTVVGGGPIGLACALFLARIGPVRLAARPGTSPACVESVPAALLTLLLELGVVPAELDVAGLTRGRLVAWEHADPWHHEGPATAHVERSALVAALWRRVRTCEQIEVVPGRPVTGRWVTGHWVDATGRRALSASTHRRPRRPWIAASVTVPRGAADPTMRIAAGPGGYAYRLGSAGWLTIGRVAPGRPPRDGRALRRAVVELGAGWLVEDTPLDARPTARRVASLSLPEREGDAGVVPLGDAALARDALASQGTSIGISEARLVADGHALGPRTADGRARHLHFLATALRECRHRDEPAWHEYRDWLETLATAQARTASSTAAPSVPATRQVAPR